MILAIVFRRPCEHSQWKVWSINRGADWYLTAYGTKFVCWCCSRYHFTPPVIPTHAPVFVRLFPQLWIISDVPTSFFFFLLLFYTHLSCDILVSLGTERFPWPTRTPWRACKYFHRCSLLLLQQPPSQKNPCAFLYLVYSHYIFCFFNLKSPQMHSFLLGTSLYTLSALQVMCTSHYLQCHAFISVHVCLHSRPPHSSLNPCSRFILQNWNSVVIHSRCSTFHSVCMCVRTEDASWAARLD